MSPHKNKYTPFIYFSGLAVITLGIYILLFGLLLASNIIDAASVAPLPMAIDAAVCFVFIGLSFFLTLKNNRKAFAIACLLNIMVIIVSVLALLHHFSGVYFLFTLGMSPVTAVTFIVTVIGLFFLNKTKSLFNQCTFHAVTFLASVVLIGHLLKIPEFYHLSFTPMSIYSAAAFFILSIAASLVNQEIGITGIFTGSGIGNIMARRLFLYMVFAIFIVGWIRLLVHRKNLVGVELGIALYALSFCLISLALISLVSKTLNTINTKANIATENFRLMVEAAPYALIMTDRLGTILEINPSAELVFGYKKEELTGKNVRVLVPKNMRGTWIKNRNKFFEEPLISPYGFNDEIYALKKNKQQFPIEIILTPIKSRDGYRILSFVIDITERKASEALINKQITELQQKNEELEQFNYISSHDLQEPLRTVANYIMMLEEDYPDQVTGEVKEHLGAINSAVTRMSRLVRSLLEFGKLGRDRVMSAIDTGILLKEVTDDLQALIKANGATVAAKGEFPTLYAYDTELRQLFQNLINNAIKFKKEGIAPHITVTGSAIDGYYRFEVADNGIGIAPEHSAKIFNIFQRLNKSEKYEGYGIGLANCKKIAEMHGGRIWVESVPGKGSTFIFTILKFKA